MQIQYHISAIVNIFFYFDIVTFIFDLMKINIAR